MYVPYSYNFWNCVSNTLHFFCKLVPNKPLRKAMKRKINSSVGPRKGTIYQHYENVRNRVGSKISRNEPVRLAFFVMYASSFAAKNLCKTFLNDERFEVSIYVVPDVYRGDAHRNKVMKETYDALSKEFDCVHKTYDTNNKFKDICKDADIVFCCSPYEHMAHKYYSLSYLKYQDVLTVYASYAYFVIKHSENIFDICRSFFENTWLLLTDSQHNIDMLKAKGILQPNLLEVGYMKLDSFDGGNADPVQKNQVLVCPHHTVQDDIGNLELSNFMRYSSYFLEMVSKYSTLEFVFRPHPLLIPTLKKREVWGETVTEDYFESLLSHKNVKLDLSADYQKVFETSAACIHDCGSFTLEYLFMDKPCCYMLKNDHRDDVNFTQDGLSCLDHYYKAHNQQEIDDFLETVVLNKQDTMSQKRSKFVGAELRKFWPYSAERARDEITSILLG